MHAKPNCSRPEGERKGTKALPGIPAGPARMNNDDNDVAAATKITRSRRREKVVEMFIFVFVFLFVVVVIDERRNVEENNTELLTNNIYLRRSFFVRLTKYLACIYHHVLKSVCVFRL